MSPDHDENLNIPIELIPDLSAKDKYLFHSISCLNKRFDEAKKETDEQNKVLNEILIQSKITNGRITKTEKDIAVLSKKTEEIEPNIEKVKLLFRVISSKLFWMGVAVILLVIVPIVITSYPPGEILAKIFGIG